MTDPLARNMVALDPRRVVRPRATPSRDRSDIVRDWLAHLEAGRPGHAPRSSADTDSDA